MRDAVMSYGSSLTPLRVEDELVRSSARGDYYRTRTYSEIGGRWVKVNETPEYLVPKMVLQ